MVLLLLHIHTVHKYSKIIKFSWGRITKKGERSERKHGTIYIHAALPYMCSLGTRPKRKKNCCATLHKPFVKKMASLQQCEPLLVCIAQWKRPNLTFHSVMFNSCQLSFTPGRPECGLVGCQLLAFSVRYGSFHYISIRSLTEDTCPHGQNNTSHWMVLIHKLIQGLDRTRPSTDLKLEFKQDI